MAHQLFFDDATGTHSFFSVKKMPWHGLGKIISEYPTSAEAIKFAGLDYQVEKRPLFTYDTQNSNANSTDNLCSVVIPELDVPNYYATLRRDKDIVLGVVGKDYQVIQNKDAFSFFDSIVGGDGIMYETAGALGAGERIFITAKLPGYIHVGSDDLIEKYLFLTTSHNGFGSITAAFTPIRIVCANTLAAALKDMKNCIKIRHTVNAKERLEQAHRVLGISNRLSEEMGQIFNQWTKVRITDRELKKLIQLAMVPNKEVLNDIVLGNDGEMSTLFKNTCNSVFEYAVGNPTQLLETTKGTVFGAYNAITGYYQNVASYKDQESKVKSILLGGTAQLRTQTAFDLCQSFAQKGESGLYLN